jgi:hypothetical protein
MGVRGKPVGGPLGCQGKGAPVWFPPPCRLPAALLAVPDLPPSGPSGWGWEVRNALGQNPEGVAAGRRHGSASGGAHSGLTPGEDSRWFHSGRREGAVMPAAGVLESRVSTDV